MAGLTEGEREFVREQYLVIKVGIEDGRIASGELWANHDDPRELHDMIRSIGKGTYLVAKVREIIEIS